MIALKEKLIKEKAEARDEKARLENEKVNYSTFKSSFTCIYYNIFCFSLKLTQKQSIKKK